MQLQQNVSLAPFTSFECGGLAEHLIECTNPDDLQAALAQRSDQAAPLWILGYGTNVLVSDHGLPGLTVITRGGKLVIEGSTLIADTGLWWDELVEASLAHKLWGLELMSGIPSSVGGAVVGNIAAYGQQVSDRLVWIEVFNAKSGLVEKIMNSEINFAYRKSSLQDRPELVVLRAAFNLDTGPTTKLAYSSALKVAEEVQLNPEALNDRQQIILEARRRAGSLYDLNDSRKSRTAGSFFKNPRVELGLAKQIASFDESGKTLELLLEQNRIHGGNEERVSAAHVLLAAGFKRGQSWGGVRLHPDHILKIENTGGASAQNIYDVAQEIMDTVKTKLSVILEPEVKFLGDFAQ